ncbi:50S ribosomal protein L4 [Candidatus Peregrinibacteria bacterium]|nr:50S ribosomal protein L4 [Candidatus Peregrinibacteria bacterium]
MKIDLYNQKGEKTGQIEAPGQFFEKPFNKDLIHQALVMQRANARHAIAHTKTKGEVRGGGKKPYSQKGTGHARQGSIRNPHYIGGGVAHGPRNDRNFSKKMPQAQRKAALYSALSEKARDKQIIALDKYESAQAKTKLFSQMLAKLPIKRGVLVILPEKDETVMRSIRNLANAKAILINYLNIADLAKYETVLFFEKALEKMKKVNGCLTPKGSDT